MSEKMNNTHETLTVEVHSTAKKAKDSGATFRSYFATEVGGEPLPGPMSVIFCGESGGKPRAAHAILTITPKGALTSSYGKDRRSGRPAIFISDPYTEKEIEPRKGGNTLCKPSAMVGWATGDAEPEYVDPDE